jgi:penicillin-binding protein 1A
MLRLLTFFLNFCLAIAFSVIVGLIYMGDQLPSVKTLRDVQLQTPLRVYTLDGKLISQFGEKRRIPVALKDVPPTLLNAFIATEDRRFYDHGGVDLRGLIRAAHHLISEGNKGQGGSTITMQLARNMFLSSQKTYVRKVNEILLALKIEHEFNKDEIMELYLNKIYLGQRAYGIASAAEVYYGKTLNELTLGQMAMIAGLPKAPSTLNPITSPSKAKERRKHVLDSMLQQHFITQAQFEAANKEPIVARYHGPEVDVRAPYLAEMVRQTMYEKLGDEAYEMGLKVYTTLDSTMQVAANQALEEGLLAFDRRQGYRGPLGKINLAEDRTKNALLDKLNQFAQTPPFYVGVIISVEGQVARVLLKEGNIITLPWSGLSWARKDLGQGRFARNPSQASEVLSGGDVIQLVFSDNEWTLAQPPLVSGALVALRPQDGAILALTGGFDFYRNNFNMATQAQRQPGSNIKPFIYSAALEHGYTPATLINDAPIVFRDPSQEALWRPENDNKEFNGPTRLRMGLVRSRNLVSIRVLEGVGIRETIDYLKRFGFEANSMPMGLSLALGTNLVTPLQLATAYATFANGGYLVEPYFIDHITDHDDQTIEHAIPTFACAPCTPQDIAPYFHHNIGAIHSAEKVISDDNAFLITNMLQDAIKRGTGRAAQALKRSDLSGKTGTTNDHKDGWFSGYNSDIVATTWIGYDNNDSLGEYAAQTALPTWIDFMRVALRNKPEHTLPQPNDIVTVAIDPQSGLLARPGQKNAEIEYFPLDAVPVREATESGSGRDEQGNPASPETLF